MVVAPLTGGLLPRLARRTGWRKPLVFGISNAMIFCSLRVALRAQEYVPRSRISHLAAWSTVVEVGVITLQAWRGVPSHFNTSTYLDATFYRIKLCSALLLSAACVGATFAVFNGRPRGAAAQVAALRHGLLLLCVAVAVGIAQVLYGHAPREGTPLEQGPCLEVTAGLRGGPCYEMYGLATVKLAHFLPLHATEVLLLIAWAASHSPRLRLGGEEGQGGRLLIHTAAAGFWCVAAVGLNETARGRDVKRPGTMVALSLLLSVGLVVAPAAIAVLSPVFGAAGGGIQKRSTADVKAE